MTTPEQRVLKPTADYGSYKTAAVAGVRGQIKNTVGRGIRNVQLTLTDTATGWKSTTLQ